MSDSKIDNKKYTVNTYEWTGEEIYFLGKYLEAQADILKQVGGRWAAAHGPSATIEIPNLSVLTTSLESVGKVAWDMRSTVQLALMKKGDNKERDELIAERRKWQTRIAEETNEHVLEAYKKALSDTLDRLDAVKRSTADDHDAKYEFSTPTGLLRERDPLSKLWQDKTLSMHEREMIEPVVRHMMERRNITEVYQALNLQWHEACDGMSRNDADLLRWAFSRFGFRWRVSDDKTRFDMPVERYKFAKSRERIKDLRAAGNRWNKPFELKLLKEDGRGKAKKSTEKTLVQILDEILQESEYALKNAHNNVIPKVWLNKVAALIGHYPSMLPEGVWGAAKDREVLDGVLGYSSDPSRLLRDICEMKLKLGDSIVLICSALPKAYYLAGVSKKHIHNLIGLPEFVNLISVIIFRWAADVELTIAEEVRKDKTSGLDRVDRWRFRPGNPLLAKLDHITIVEEMEEKLIPIIRFDGFKEETHFRMRPFFKLLPQEWFHELIERQRKP